MLTKILITLGIIAVAMFAFSFGKGRKQRQVNQATKAAEEATRRRVHKRLNLKECRVCSDFVTGRCHREDCGMIDSA